MLTSSNMADNYTRKCLEEAIKSDDFWEVYRILSKLSPRQQYQVITMEAGFSLLHVAASENHLNAMSAALSVLATANMVAVLTSADRKYHTVLDCAVLHNHPKMVKLVLQRLSLPERERLLDVRVSNQTALHHACDKGYTDVLSVILQHVGRDFIKKLLASKNSKGMTPLECASKKHLFDVERCLLENLGIDKMADLEVVVLQPASNPQNLLQPKAECSLPHKPPTALIFYQTNTDIPGFERQGDVLAPFLFIIVIDYISKLSAGNYGYLTHKGTAPSGRVTRATTHRVDRKMNDLAFADDIAELENDNAQAQKQLDELRHHASTVGLEINDQKTEQIRQNVPDTCTPPPPLVIDGQPIKIVDEFKYLGSYVGNTENDVNNRIALAWAAFTRLKSILTSRSGKPAVKIKIRLFNAACVSILLYACETWVLTAQLTNKLDIFARKCYRIMLGIRQSETHMTNAQLYKEVNTRPISDIIRERQLQFIGHCLRMPNDEPANIYALYMSNIKSNRRGRGRKTYLDQVSEYLGTDKDTERQSAANEIVKHAKDKKIWKKLVAAPKQPDR